MPFVLVGLVVLAGAGVVALMIHNASDAQPGAGPALGATERVPDPPSAPTTDFQTTSAAESPSNTIADDRANEQPDKFMDSPAATTDPIGVNTPDDPFLMMAQIPSADVARGYAIDDLTQPDTSSPFEDDIVEPRDLAFAPAAYAGGLMPEEMK